MLSLISLVIGILLIFIPTKIWKPQSLKIPIEVFKKDHTESTWVYYVLKNLPLIWFILYLLIVAPLLTATGNFGMRQMYSLTFLLGGGAALILSVIEIVKNITVVYSFGKSKKLSATSIIIEAQVRRLGLYRLALFAGAGIVPLFFI